MKFVVRFVSDKMNTVLKKMAGKAFDAKEPDVAIEMVPVKAKA